MTSLDRVGGLKTDEGTEARADARIQAYAEPRSAACLLPASPRYPAAAWPTATCRTTTIGAWRHRHTRGRGLGDRPGRRAPSSGALGIDVGGTYYGEAFANSGGFKQGGNMTACSNSTWMPTCRSSASGRVFASTPTAIQIHGHSITADNIGSLMPVSNLEATPATRLNELWLEQHMFNDKLAVKVWPARRRRRVHDHRRRRLLLERHLGLAVDHGLRHAERRSGLSAGHARRPRRRHTRTTISS